jgi:aspartate 1-decarboxylase
MNQVTTSTATGANVGVRVKSAPPFQLSTIQTSNRWLKILIYGKHGSGKTTLAGSAADVDQMNDIFMINVESGEMVFADNERIKHPERIDIADVSNFKQAAKMYEFLASHAALWKRVDAGGEDGAQALQKIRQYEAALRGVSIEEIAKPKRYRTVIVDSLTELEAYCMYNLLGIHGEFDLGQIDDDMKTAEFAEYKKNNNMVNLLVRAFRDLPMHVIILCGQTYYQDELKRFYYAPHLTGKLATQIQGYFDVVGYLAVGSPNDKGDAPRRLYVQPVGKWDAKNRRSSYREPFFDNPTMTSILQGFGLLQKKDKAA